MISSLLHLVGLRPRVYYTLINFRGGGGKAPLAPPPQYANDYVCEECDETFLRHIMKALKCFTNVLLNNYTKNDTDKLGSMKQSRKVSKLN